MSLRRTACAPCFVLVAAASVACTSETAEPNRASSAASDAASAAMFGEPLRLSIKVPSVAPGSEGTQCVRVNLGNQGPIQVGKIHNTLSKSSPLTPKRPKNWRSSSGDSR